MARNFRGLKISQFSRINHEPRNFYPRKFYPSSFLMTRTVHTQCMVLLVSTWPSVIFSILCSVAVSLWPSTYIFKLRRNLVASYPILVVLFSRLILLSSIVSAYEKMQSVLEGKERTQSGRKGRRYSKLAPELRAKNQQAGSRARRGCYSQVIC